MGQGNQEPNHRARAIYSWVVAAAAAAALAAALPASGWPQGPEVILLLLAAVVASMLVVPMPAGGHQTLRPAIAAAAFEMFGAPVAAVAMAVGVAVGNGALRRRPLVVTAFNAGQLVLATLAAGWITHLVRPAQAFWAPLSAGRLDVSHALALLAGAATFAIVSATLVSWYLAVDRRQPFVDMLGANVPLELVVGSLLFAAGAIVGLVMKDALPSSALLTVVPIAFAATVLLALAGRRQAAAELEVLYEAAQEMNRAQTVGEVTQAIAVGLDRLVTTDIAIFWLRPPGEAEARVVHYQGPGGMEAARQFQPVGLTAHAMRTGRPVRVGDYEHDLRRNPRAEARFGSGTLQSALVVPMTAATEVWGAVALGRNTRGYFSSRHERLVATLASHAAQAIRNVHLFEESRRQVDRLTALKHLGVVAGTTLDPDEACRILVERAAEALGARYAFLSLLDEPTRELRGQEAHGVDAREFRRLRARADGEADILHEAARAFRERRPVACEADDDPQAPISRCPTLRALPDACSALTAPLMRQGRPVGALTVVRTEPRPFTEPETAVLEAIAAQGAATIESGQVYASTAERLRRMEAAVELFGRLGAAADLRSVCVLAAEGARHLFDTERCLLVAWDGQGPVGEALGAGLSDEFVRAAAAHLQAGIGRHVAQAYHPVVVEDLPADPRVGPLRDAAAREMLRSGVFFALRARGAFVGTLALLYPAERGDLPADLGLAAAFAGQVALAASRAALLEQSERRREEVALLNRIVGSVNASLDPVEVYRTAVAGLAEAVGLSRVSIHRVEGALLRLVSQIGAPDAPIELPLAAEIRGRVVRSGRAEFVANVREDPDYVLSSFEVTSQAVVPILLDGAAAGVLTVEGTASRPVTAQVLEFLTAFGQQLGVAVRNASLYEDLRRTHDELQVLFEAAKAISGTLDLRTLLDSLVSVTCRAFDYENGALLMADPDTGELVVEAAYGYRDSVVGIRLPQGVSLSGWVARSGSPVVVDDVRQDARYHQADERTRSALAVPLIAEGKVLGVFNVESARLAAFGPRDLHLLSTLASYAVVAIQNARLYEQAKRLAITDGLTELYNHRHLYEALERLMERARRDAQPLSIIMVEIDQFKHYNDTYGHKSGDEVLRTVAGLLRRGSRPSDIVARYGGDEFMVVLPGVGKSAASETAERLRRTVEAYPLILGNEVITTVTLSVGVAAFPQDGGTANSLVEAVDHAQYLAKRSGGNKVHVAHGT